jgi:hypothetical protein
LLPVSKRSISLTFRTQRAQVVFGVVEIRIGIIGKNANTYRRDMGEFVPFNSWHELEEIKIAA